MLQQCISRSEFEHGRNPVLELEHDRSLLGSWSERWVGLSHGGRAHGESFPIDQLNEWRSWERFTIVHADDKGRVGLYSDHLSRFVRMEDDGTFHASGGKTVSVDSRPTQHQIFHFCDAGDFEVAVYAIAARRFLRLADGKVDGHGGQMDIHELPPRTTWGAERFIWFPHP